MERAEAAIETAYGRRKGRLWTSARPGEAEPQDVRARGTPRYIEGETEPQRGTTTCPKSHNGVSHLLSPGQSSPCFRAAELTAGVVVPPVSCSVG